MNFDALARLLNTDNLITGLLMLLIALSFTKELISGLENPTARETNKILRILIPAVLMSLLLVLANNRLKFAT